MDVMTGHFIRGEMPPVGRMDMSSTSHVENKTVSHASFNGRKVEKEADSSPKLTVYLNRVHSFVRLENKDRKIDIVRGFYPKRFPLKPNFDLEGAAITSSMLYGIATMPRPKGAAAGMRFVEAAVAYKVFLSRGAGDVRDELEQYKDAGGIEDIPKVSFSITSQEALEIEQYITGYSDACKNSEAECGYRFLGFNCVDFSQSVFSKTSHKGHFIEYFPASTMLLQSPEVALYKPYAQPAVSVSIAGTAMLATSLGCYFVPKITSAVKSIANWWTGSVPEDQQVKENLKTDDLEEMYGTVEAQFKACDKFWEEYELRNESTSELISDSTDLLFRFLEVEERMAKCRRTGKGGDLVKSELKTLDREFRYMDMKFKLGLGEGFLNSDNK